MLPFLNYVLLTDTKQSVSYTHLDVYKRQVCVCVCVIIYSVHSNLQIDLPVKINDL